MARGTDVCGRPAESVPVVQENVAARAGQETLVVLIKGSAAPPSEGGLLRGQWVSVQ